MARGPQEVTRWAVYGPGPQEVTRWAVYGPGPQEVTRWAVYGPWTTRGNSMGRIWPVDYKSEPDGSRMTRGHF